MKKYLLTLIILTGIAFSLQAIPFTLRNTGFKSIYLKIPGVMNPNLSPISNSGVDLKAGQKIFFFHNNKKYLLLQVTDELTNSVVNVNAVIKARKKELGLD